MNIQPSRYQRYRFPSETISHAIWLYHRFCLSFRYLCHQVSFRYLCHQVLLRR